MGGDEKGPPISSPQAASLQGSIQERGDTGLVCPPSWYVPVLLQTHWSCGSPPMLSLSLWGHKPQHSTPTYPPWSPKLSPYPPSPPTPLPKIQPDPKSLSLLQAWVPLCPPPALPTLSPPPQHPGDRSCLSTQAHTNRQLRPDSTLIDIRESNITPSSRGFQRSCPRPAPQRTRRGENKSLGG